MSERKLYITVDQDGLTKGYQISIDSRDEKGTGRGTRLAGPKYCGMSRTLKRALIGEREAADIRSYLDEHFPVTNRARGEGLTMEARKPSEKPQEHVRIEMRGNAEGVIAYCSCGWNSGNQPNSMQAAFAFMDHKNSQRPKSYEAVSYPLGACKRKYAVIDQDLRCVSRHMTMELAEAAASKRNRQVGAQP